MKRAHFFILTTLFVMLFSTGAAFANGRPSMAGSNWFVFSIPLALLAIFLVNPRINWFNFILFVIISTNRLIFRSPVPFYVIITLYLIWFVLAWKASRDDTKTTFHAALIPIALLLFFPGNSMISSAVVYVLTVAGCGFSIFSAFNSNEDKKITFYAANDSIGKGWPESNPFLKKWGRTAGIILGAWFITTCIISIASDRYSELYVKHRFIMNKLEKCSGYIDDYREAHKNDAIPSQGEFNEYLHELYRSQGYHRGERLEIKYNPSPDRRNYSLYYSGDIFRKSRWFLLPQGYPRYSSVRGMEPGKRVPFFLIFYVEE